MSTKIIVIGGGVSGITTALLLQVLGYETEVVTEKTTRDVPNKNNNPEFASLFPSASVIPHSVYSDRLEHLFRHSQSTFYELRKHCFPGLTTHRHYELFEFDPVRPDYCGWMLNFRAIDELDAESVPKREGAGQLKGWMFDCIFADWPLYFPALMDLYEELGGNIIRRKIGPNGVAKLSSDIVINCSGTGSPDLIGDPMEEQLVMRGHLLHYPEAPLVTDADGEIVSYNYTPGADTYADAEGEPCDVYCYPRQDGWILGGSRQKLGLDDKIAEQEQELEREAGETYSSNGIAFPRQIIDLNADILDHTYGLSLERSDAIKAMVGYRYIRSTDNGLRLEKEDRDGKAVYHNYGHGGAGVTLSWGCALQIAAGITGSDIPELQDKLLDKMDTFDF